MSYDHKKIDAKWQKRWEEAGVFEAQTNSNKEKFYVLVEFPYPSGAGLHVGHPRSYTALDVVARKKRMERKNVLFPMGWDAFGLPAENYAIKTGVHPSIVTKQNIDTFRRQLKSIGFSFDWSREINTTDPKYYRWTQWQFLQFFKAGLAYKAKAFINWCPKDKIGLANEEVIGGCCERCGTPVEKREKEQWMIAITKYADRLIDDLKDVDYLFKIKKQQEDWIGRSEGAEIDFVLDGSNDKLTVFTTRPDTLFGVTYVVLAPEHPLVAQITTAKKKETVEKYVAEAKKKTDIERGDESKDKTGVFTGAFAVNPINGEKVPVWVADYVLAGYGTGAVMAVPAHDERDFAFAKKYELPMKWVVAPLIECHGICEYRPDKPMIVRPCATAIIRRENDGKYLILKFADGRTGFAGGGLEEGETAESSILREVLEETGHEGKIEHIVVPAMYGTGYKPKKDVNCFDPDTVFLVTVDGDKQGELSEDDKTAHELLWVDEKDVSSYLSLEHHQFAWSWHVQKKQLCFTGEGVAFDSEEFTHAKTAEAKEKIITKLEELGVGRRKTTYRLRDWVFSRQRYWGEPIPLVHCEKDGWVAVPDEELPVALPQVEKYEPTDTGESPLAAIDEFVNTTCPTCGGPAKRETDTMPNWAGSSWYFLRYTDPQNDESFASKEALKYWMPVDLYNGGMEHTTLHLLYSRFWNKFLFDQGLVPTSEPYARRHSHGLIMSEDGTKMSKSKGNVVNPDDVVGEYGADAFRTYILFMGPFEEPVPWSTNGLIGVRRFLEKIERLSDKLGDDSHQVSKALNKTIKKVSDDIEGFRFNTAVAELMKFVNVAQDAGGLSKDSFAKFLTLLSPFAPHLTNELWEKLGMKGLVEEQPWPVADASMLVEDEVTIVVQVNGKVRANIVVSTGISDAELIKLAKADENVQKHLTGEVKKEIVVKGKLVNLVV